VIIVNGIWQYNAFGVWRALSGTPTPYCVFTHGMLDPWFKTTYPLKHLKKWLYWPWADYRVLRDASAVLFTCEEELRLARHSFWLFACREAVVNYGTAGPKGDATAQRRAFLERFPQLRDRRCILFLGRVHVKKGPDLLFRAFAGILGDLRADATGDAHLVMAGPHDHPYGRAMAHLVERLNLADRVTWTGMLAGDVKWGAYHAADAFILPSHQENFGIAVAEALACGVPVLITHKVNIWREIEAHGAGLVANDDLEGTRSLLERWLTLGPAERTAMRLAARACFEKCYDIEGTASRFIEILDGIGLRHDGDVPARG
jgi:glycosyltransferase involved in cell wall biosynthesis